MLTVVFSLASALCLATSSVLEHRAVGNAASTPEQAHPSGRGTTSSPGGLRLLARLLKDPLWLLGAMAALCGFALHARALRGGSLVVVQPVLVSGLLFALPLSVLLSRRRPRGQEWAAALVVVAGLVLFLLCARPAAGGPGRGAVLAALVAVVAIMACGCVWLARTVLVRHRALLLGTAAGLAHGAAAALLKHVVEGVPARGLMSWAVPALLGALLSALLLTQAAYAAGDLAASLPALTVVDPVVAVALGALAFGERLDTAPGALLGQTLGLIVVTAGMLRLAVWQAQDGRTGDQPRSGGSTARSDRWGWRSRGRTTSSEQEAA